MNQNTAYNKLILNVTCKLVAILIEKMLLKDADP